MESGIPKAIGTRNPSYTDTKLESMAWNPDSKILLDPLHEAICYTKENYCLTSVHRIKIHTLDRSGDYTKDEIVTVSMLMPIKKRINVNK